MKINNRFFAASSTFAKKVSQLSNVEQQHNKLGCDKQANLLWHANDTKNVNYSKIINMFNQVFNNNLMTHQNYKQYAKKTVDSFYTLRQKQ